MIRVIFACVHNAGRSQMAAAFLEQMADPARVAAVSAGTQPAGAVHPEVVACMAEIGIDLAGRRPQLLTVELAQSAQLLVTMGCGDTCPYVPGLEMLLWQLQDPKGKGIADVRAIREQVRNLVQGLVAERAWAPPEPMQ